MKRNHPYSDISPRSDRSVRPDTIVAVSSAAGASARAIVRLSGPRAVAVADALFLPDIAVLGATAGLSSRAVSALPAWSVVRGALRVPAFAAPVPALLYLMRAPRSYTREDVVEFHIIGSPPVASAVIDAIVSRGVRLARPGEFTERAYLSGRIDLTQAEAVLKLIGARTDAEERLAVGELTGELSRRIADVAERLLELLTQTELALDFTEDEVPVVEPGDLADELASAADEIDDLRRSGASGAVFSERPRVGIVGRTNAGKSSLFNHLLDRDEAIVTDISGTTRDVLEAECRLDDTDLLLVDTAGEKPTQQDTSATAGLSSRAPGADERCPAVSLTLPLGPRVPSGREATLSPSTPLGTGRGERERNAHASTDPDDLAIARARAEREKADLVLLVIDASQPLTAVDMTLLSRLGNLSEACGAAALGCDFSQPTAEGGRATSSFPPLPASGGAASSSPPLPLGERVGVRGVPPLPPAGGESVPSLSPLPPGGGEGRGEGGISPEGALDRGVSIVVLNKTDLDVDDETERIVRRRALAVNISCKTGFGIDRLRDEICQHLTTGGVERSGQRFVFNLRQVDALRRAKATLDRAASAAREDIGLEFPAADIRAAIGALRELTHPLDEEEILDRIFSRFCIGK